MAPRDRRTVDQLALPISDEESRKSIPLAEVANAGSGPVAEPAWRASHVPEGESPRGADGRGHRSLEFRRSFPAGAYPQPHPLP
jgi:hypothetical protein